MREQLKVSNQYVQKLIDQKNRIDAAFNVSALTKISEEAIKEAANKETLGSRGGTHTMYKLYGNGQ